MDRALASGARCAGSIPVGRTITKNLTRVDTNSAGFCFAELDVECCQAISDYGQDSAGTEVGMASRIILKYLYNYITELP